ncbi:DUF551 domain-containing protein [Raoultella planticola]|uniref:DUF551 domain-containing protein n=1 Tax=Raoultella planticola TaxID=575 RepID=UPI003525DD72
MTTDITELAQRLAICAKEDTYPVLSPADCGALVEALYRHAQPAPVVTFYRDGIEAAAKWIDQQREAYDSEHGRHDTGTGFFEFGNDAQREYSSTLEELAEGIRAMHPNARSSPVIPDRWIPVSERMPEADGNYWGWWSESKRQGPVWFIKSELQAQFQSHEITHWMPLPAAPQEVKGE